MSSGMTAAMESCAVFPAAVMASIAGVTTAVASFVGVEVFKRSLTVSGDRPSITVAWIPAVIYVTVKTRMSMEPRSGADENAADEPVGSVVAIGSAIVRGVVEVTVGTYRWGSNAYRNLRRCVSAGSAKEAREREQAKSPETMHISPLPQRLSDLGRNATREP